MRGPNRFPGLDLSKPAELCAPNWSGLLVGEYGCFVKSKYIELKKSKQLILSRLHHTGILCRNQTSDAIKQCLATRVQTKTVKVRETNCFARMFNCWLPNKQLCSFSGGSDNNMWTYLLAGLAVLAGWYLDTIVFFSDFFSRPPTSLHPLSKSCRKWLDCRGTDASWTSSSAAYRW